MPTSRLLLAPLAAAALAAAAASPARAADRTLCLNAPSCPAGATKLADGLSLQSALAAAKSNAGIDTILLGDRGGTPYAGPFAYAGDTSANAVTLAAAPGEHPVLVSATPEKPVLDIAGSGSELRGLEVDVPALPRVDGVRIQGGRVVGTTIIGQGDGSAQTALTLTGGGSVRSSFLALDHGLAFSLTGPATVDGSTLRGSVGAVAADADLWITNSRFH